MNRPMLFPQPHTPARPRPPQAKWARCPKCGTDTGVPVRAMPNGYGETPEGEPPARLACAACGDGWRGTDEEVDRAERKEAAFQRREG